MKTAQLPSDYSQLIASVSARLVRATSESLDDEIMFALREALQPLSVDRGGLLRVEVPVVQVSHVWYVEGSEQVSGEVNLAELFPWSYHRMIVLGNVRVVNRVDDLPPEAEVDKQTYHQMGVKSSFGIPLFVGEHIRYLFVAQSKQAEFIWSEDLIVHMRLLGEVFVNALQRRDDDDALRYAKKNLDLAASSAGAGLWSLDYDTGRIWATEAALEMFGYEPDMELTLETFLLSLHEDDRGLIATAVDVAGYTGEEFNVEYRILESDGRVRWMNSRGRTQAVRRGQRKRLMGVTIEITQRKQAEAQYQEQLKQVEMLKDRLEKENLYLQSEAEARGGRKVLSRSGGLDEVKSKARQVAGTKSTVLIQGETGVGKELVAKTIHRFSECSERPMIVVSCASLPAGLVESELFGREKGAFTGALTKQAGRFELAKDTSLFLDEVGELPMEAQSKLLRVLQEGTFERLGSSRTIKSNARVIAATNRDLLQEVEHGRFRRDLYYRLNVFPIYVPPLRERRDDIPGLVWECVAEFGERMGKKVRRVAERDIEALKAYSWPGNVRELRNVIEHAMIVSDGEVLKLHRSDFLQAHGTAESMTLESVERRHVRSVLELSGGKIKGPGGAAELLGLNPSTLYFRMRKLGLFAGSGKS